MRFLKSTLLLVLVSLAASISASADSVSYTGALSSSTDVFQLAFTIGGTTSEAVSIQTWGFGGGINAEGQTISAGGFDPLIGLFAGTGSSAQIFTDGVGDPFATSDVLSNYPSFAGCPPAGTVNIGGAVCGDVKMSLSLMPGSYTLVLVDGSNIPNAVFDNGTLGEGFTDFTGGAFQTCNGVDANGNPICVTDTANWAFDLTTSPTVPVPEPSSPLLLAVALFGVGCWQRGRFALRKVKN